MDNAVKEGSAHRRAHRFRPEHSNHCSTARQLVGGAARVHDPPRAASVIKIQNYLLYRQLARIEPTSDLQPPVVVVLVVVASFPVGISFPR
jgi:hypothetical protein